MKQILILLLAIICNSANAVVMPSLYSTEIVLQNNTEQEYINALEQALDQIILKVASNNKALQHPEVVMARKDIKKYLVSYSSYNDGSSLKLKVRFNESMLQALLNRADFGFLSKNRPLTLVWLQSNIDHQILQTTIEKLSNDYGIPMVAPAINLPDIDLNEQQIKELSKRYNADLVLKAKIFAFDDNIDCHWEILEANENIGWKTTGIDPNSEIDQMLNFYAENLINRFAKVPVNHKVASQVYTLKIIGINNAKDYNKINEHLINLAQVKNLEVKDINNDYTSFKVSTDVSKGALLKALSMGKLLDGDNDSLDESKLIVLKANL